ncbi:hypothetical protein ACFW2E_47475, partial [Streptomyces sp. NPDC058964]
VLEQLDLLGEEVVPVLRTEFAKGRSSGVPDHPPVHPAVAALRGSPAGPDTTEITECTPAPDGTP